MRTLQDSHVVITGATGALGRAVAQALVEAGAHCHVPAIETRCPPTASLRQGFGHHGIDLSDEASVAGFYATLPPLHAVVNIAGGFAWAPIADSPLKVCSSSCR
jgi:NAD(P)-dependent dehydrogenase (short-subunit alcohol dehydrogenase family)